MNLHTAIQRGFLVLSLAAGIAGSGVSAAHAGGGGLHPDLVVQHGTADASGHERIIIGNIGVATAGPFRIAVLAGSYSYSIMVSGLGQGKHQTITLKTLSCSQPVAVIVDMDKQTGDSNYGNNSTSFKAGCPIDPGADLHGVME